MEKFAIGLLVGGMAGAILATNNYKMRALVRKGQEEVQNKLDEMMDEKIRQMENGAEKLKEKTEEKTTKKKEET